MVQISDLNVKIFADGADLAGIESMYSMPWIKGFTTNPTLMRKAGVTNYKLFAIDVLKSVPDRPVSFEVFADEFDEMEVQAKEIATWGPNVNVKIPVTNTQGQFSGSLLRTLSEAGVKLNITAVMTLEQVIRVADSLASETSAIISVFAGRIADTGSDPLPIMREALEIIKDKPNVELLWASPRELLNIIQAHEIGCHIITVTHDILKKLSLLGKCHQEFSLETVEMFYKDAREAEYHIPVAEEIFKK